MIARFAPLQRFLDGQLDGIPATDEKDRAQQLDLLTTCLALGLIGAGAFPIWLAMGAPGAIFGALTFFWLLAPLGVAGFLLRTGNLASAHILAAVCMSGLVAWLAAVTGGLASPILAWLGLVPLSALVLRRRSVTIPVLSIVAAALLFVVASSLWGSPRLPQWGVSPSLAAAIVAGAVAAIVWRARDLLDRRGLHSDATAIDPRLSLVAEHGGELITSHDGAGRVSYASPSASALLGVAAGDLLGDGLARRIQIADRPRYLTALSDALRGAEAVTAEYRIRAQGDGSGADPFIWVETRFCCGGDQANAALVGVTRDISDRKALEAASEEAKLLVDSANAAKGSFLAHMSHELRTPLNSIVGFSEILAGDDIVPFDAARWREYAGLIRSSGEHLLHVVNDLLDVSKMEAGRHVITPEPCMVEQLVAESLASLEPQALRRSIKIVSSVSPDLPEVCADRRACRQILINLLSNAIKFSHAGGVVALSAGVRDGQFVLRIEDHGVGIAETDMKNIGSPFFQADSSYTRHYEGTGLGLSVVKGLVGLHGGTLTIRSKAGFGTTVEVALPLGQPSAARSPSPVTVDLFGKERRSA